MNNNPLVTVLMPTYGHEKYLLEALQSILSQSYKNIQLIITNDGSPDESDKTIHSIMSSLEERFINFKYIYRPNKGLLPTLKEMEPLIEGKYITVFYSDDIYTEDRIKKQVESLEVNPEFALCYGKMIGINERSDRVKEYKTKYCKSGFVFEDLMKRNFIPAPTVMMRTEVFQEVGGFDLNFAYDDYPLWLKIAYKHQVLFVDEFFILYRTHEENLSGDLYRTISTVEKILLSWSDEKITKSILKKFYLKSFYELVRSEYNYKKEAQHYMEKAMSSWYHPKFIKALFRYYFKRY
jgi:alpha-1,3-rhamnosyltransferase